MSHWGLSPPPQLPVCPSVSPRCASCVPRLLCGAHTCAHGSCALVGCPPPSSCFHFHLRGHRSLAGNARGPLGDTRSLMKAWGTPGRGTVSVGGIPFFRRGGRTSGSRRLCCAARVGPRPGAEGCKVTRRLGSPRAREGAAPGRLGIHLMGHTEAPCPSGRCASFSAARVSQGAGSPAGACGSATCRGWGSSAAGGAGEAPQSFRFSRASRWRWFCRLRGPTGDPPG